MLFDVLPPGVERDGRGVLLDDGRGRVEGVLAEPTHEAALSDVNAAQQEQLEEALDADDATLSAAYKKRYDRRRVPKYRAAPVVKGDRVRYLVRSVVGKHKQALGYKSYRGKHWSAEVHRGESKHTRGIYYGVRSGLLGS